MVRLTGARTVLVVDRLTADQKTLVLSFAARYADLEAGARKRLALSIAHAIRGDVPGGHEFPDDVAFVVAVAAAIQVGAREADAPAGSASDSSGRDDISGRRYLLSRLDGLVSSGALDRGSAERVRDLVARELAEIEGARAAQLVGPAAARIVPSAVEAPAGPSAADRFAEATTRFATEQTPSLLLYIGAFLVVVAAFIFVSVSGDQISDLVKLVLMLVGTTGFLGAGIACHRYPRVLPAGRTFLVIGALIAPLDIAAYYALVARASPLDAPALWAIGSLICAALYAGLRLGGYGVGYSYAVYAALLSAVFGGEALVKLPLAWAAVPIAALAVAIEWLHPRAKATLATLIAPFPRITMAVAALAVVALAIPIGSNLLSQRAGLPAGAALLTMYYVLRSRAGARWERVCATIGPGVTILGIAYSMGATFGVLGLVSVLVGGAYLTHELFPAVDRAITANATWAARDLTPIGLVLLVAGLLPIAAFASAPFLGAAAYLVAAAVLIALSLVWDGRSGAFAELRGEYLLGAAAAAIVVAYRFAVAAAGLLPLAQTGVTDLARAYAPLSFGAWIGAVALLRRPAHALVAMMGAAALTLAVSLGSYADAPVHTIANAIYAAGAAAVAIRMRDRRVLWIAAGLALLSALGTYRWSGALPAWAPVIALAPAAIACAASYVPSIRALRGALLQIAVAVSIFAVGLGLALGPGIAPWDSAVWRTAMLAVAAAGGFGALEARRTRSLEVGLAAGFALPLLIDMAILTFHPTLPESLTAPLAAYGFVAVWIARRSAIAPLKSAAPVFEYVAAALTIVPTLQRVTDFTTLIASFAIAFALLGAAARWQLTPTARVALLGLVWLAVTRVYVDPRIDEIRIAAGALLLALCVLSIRSPRILRLPEVSGAELVAAALIVLPTAAVTLLSPGESHFDVPVPLLLCIEVAALLAVAVVYERRILLRALIVVSCIAGFEFVGLSSYGEWYAALLGSAMINAALGIARRWTAGRTLREHAVLGAVGVGVLFLPSVGDSLAQPTFELTAQILAAGVGVAIAGGLLGEVWITAAALGVVALESTVVMRLPSQLQILGVAAGVVLMGIAISFPRFRRRGLPLRFSAAFDLLGLWLYLMPTFLLTFSNAAALQHAILMAQLVALTLSGLAFRRRWQIIAAIVMIGGESVRGIFEVVNRIPSFATFAISGALLLTIGFLLLLKREFFERLRRRLMHWWVAWLAASS
jgi:hypothetical protein